MEKSARAEIIAALVTDKHSGFVDGDESILEAASDARLEQFRSAADVRRSAANDVVTLETNLRNTSARLKVAEDRLKVAEAPMSEEDFIARAPASIKTVLESRKAEEDTLRAALVSQLKDCGANTEDELKGKSIAELKTLAKYARVDVPDFSGRGMPNVERHASVNDKVNYAPPDGYAEALKKQAGSKTVN